MQINLDKNTKKIFTAFSRMEKLPKSVIKYGSLAFLALFLIGTALFAYNHLKLNNDEYFGLISTTIIKSSFTILAEGVIGGLLIDYICKKG